MLKTEEILKSGSISALNQLVATCKRCELYKTKICDVPGEGNPRAEIMFIGEAPGRDEDLEGRPFVGRAGKLLNELFSGVRVRREKIFITNLVKHRPPQNRKPKKQEIKKCFPYLEKQIELIKPKLIVLLGSFPLGVFFKQEKISKSHGQFLPRIIPKFKSYLSENNLRMQKKNLSKSPEDSIGILWGLKKNNQIYLSLYHPAAAIYNQKLKKTLIKDFKKLKEYKK